MALDQNGTVITAWTDAEIAAREGFLQEDAEKMAQNQIAAKNLLDRFDNAWSKGSDRATHFREATVDDTTASIALHQSTGALHKLDNGGTVILDEANHLVDCKVGQTASEEAAVYYLYRMQADTVPMEIETRFKATIHHAETEPVIGFVSALHLRAPADGVFFTRGTNANSYSAISRSGGVTRTTTNNLTGGEGDYLDWDRLRITYDGTLATPEAKFYIHDGSSWVLKATHTISLPNTVLLYSAIQFLGSGGFTQGTQHGYFDYLISRAMQNSLSP